MTKKLPKIGMKNYKNMQGNFYHFTLYIKVYFFIKILTKK